MFTSSWDYKAFFLIIFVFYVFFKLSKCIYFKMYHFKKEKQNLFILLDSINLDVWDTQNWKTL